QLVFSSPNDGGAPAADDGNRIPIAIMKPIERILAAVFIIFFPIGNFVDPTDSQASAMRTTAWVADSIWEVLRGRPEKQVAYRPLLPVRALHHENGYHSRFRIDRQIGAKSPIVAKHAIAKV